MFFALLVALESEEDRGFFAGFYKKYNMDFYRYALSILGDPVMAEDAVQDSWFRCVRNAEAFFAVKPRERKPWMVIVVKRVCFTMLKKESRTIQLDDSYDIIAPEASDAQGIVDVIRSMSEQYREILELKYVMGWLEKEIAVAVNLPITTVRTRIVRGRKILQEKLIREGYRNVRVDG